MKSQDLRTLLKLGISSADRVMKGRKIKPSKVEKSDSKIIAIFNKKRTISSSIDLEKGEYFCSCEDHQFRKTFCKHLASLYFNSEDKEEILKALKEKKEQIIASNYISTGSETLDSFLGGGLPVSSITNLVGRSKVGKSLFAAQVASYISIMKDAPALYIDSEAMFATQDARDRVLSFFEKRFNGKSNIDFIEIRDLESFAELLGLDIKILPTESGKRLDALINYTSFTEECSLFEMVKEIEYKFVVVDSFSSLIKRAIPVPPQQNYPARAATMNVLFGRLDEVVEKNGIAGIVVNHISIAPDKPYDRGRLFGGSAMTYNSKFILQILGSERSIKRKFRLLYAPGRREDEIEVELRPDYGYV